MQPITFTEPDDFHLHVRDGELMRLVVPHTARRFARAIIMPNLHPPVESTEQAGKYRERILASVPSDVSFEPLITLYLTEETPPNEIVTAKESGFVHGVKWYPAGATTNSQHGVREIAKSFNALEAMQEHGLPLLVHPETTDSSIDTFDREAVFIDRELTPVIDRFPNLQIVLEHVTTRQGVQFVYETFPRVAGTITVHHLLLNRVAMFEVGSRPHHYCLPILKREEHRVALVEAATSGPHDSFLVRIALRTHERPKSLIAVVRGFTRRMPRSNSTPKYLTAPVRSTDSRPSRASMTRTFMAYPGTKLASPWNARLGKFPPPFPLRTMPSSPFVLARR